MNKKLLVIGVCIIAILILWTGISIYPDWLWFENLGFSPVFLTMFFSKFGFGAVVWICLISLIFINLYIAKKLTAGQAKDNLLKGKESYAAQFGISEGVLNTLIIAFILILSYVVASRSSGNWGLLLRYLYQEPFGSTDPVFNKDIGFYIFSLPFYNFLRDGLLLLFVLSGAISIGWYLKNGILQIEGDVSPINGAPPSPPKIRIAPAAGKHLIFLGGIILLLFSWGYYLKIYSLLYSTHGAAFGAGYTDVNIRIWGYRALILLSTALSVILFSNAFNFRKKILLYSIGSWFAGLVVFTLLIPAVAQKVIVEPNELTRETPYIAHNIINTREAYNLVKIDEVDFEIGDRLSLEDLEQNDITIQNIRVWDERPLLQTYKQLQAIRLYYDFHSVSVDRYTINDQYRQIMLSARELVSSQLPAQANTWVNRHLIFTHGYGAIASPVNEVSSEGLPNFFIKDLPPVSEPGLEINRPEIYFGERTEDFVLVRTNTEEFDYPSGDQNIYTLYEGEGGVPIGSFARRLLFAIEFMDPQILFTGYLNPESRIMYNRKIRNRAKLIAPFLNYDRDPYLVVSEGELFWIMDAYTTSDMYPYSSRASLPGTGKRINYIRNSVKVIINAYDGKISFYAIDETDPILGTWSNIFPGLFKPFDEMPSGLKKHIRYPRDFFKIQAELYTKYHMENPQVFYNQEDLWQIPDEIYGEVRQPMEPYYIIQKLPGEKREEFFLMLPFTPSNRDNMIGWLAARCDMPGYGNLVVYRLPKDKLIYGPMQIEARIDQQTDISRELSLWGQRGSRVIRGNLLAIPINDTFIYVEPVYLEARQDEVGKQVATAAQAKERPRGLFPAPPQTGTAPAAQRGRPRMASALPEMGRIIVAFGNRVVMEETLDKALIALFGDRETIDQPVSPDRLPVRVIDESLSGLASRALEHYNTAREYLRQENWTGYGSELDKLEEVLLEITDLENRYVE